MIKGSLIIIVSLFCHVNLWSHDNQTNPQKAIVLINGEAFLVDVDKDGTILTTYQKVNNYFTSSEPHEKMLVRLSKSTRNEQGGIAFYELEKEYKAPYIEENKAPIARGNTQYIGFSPEQALLNKAAVDQIRKIAGAYSKGEIRTISIQSFYERSYKSRSISRNRSDAIKDLLAAFGVLPDDIVLGSQELKKGQSANFVSLAIN